MQEIRTTTNRGYRGTSAHVPAYSEVISTRIKRALYSLITARRSLASARRSVTCFARADEATEDAEEVLTTSRVCRRPLRRPQKRRAHRFVHASRSGAVRRPTTSRTACAATVPTVQSSESKLLSSMRNSKAQVM